MAVVLCAGRGEEPENEHIFSVPSVGGLAGYAVSQYQPGMSAFLRGGRDFLSNWFRRRVMELYTVFRNWWNAAFLKYNNGRRDWERRRMVFCGCRSVSETGRESGASAIRPHFVQHIQFILDCFRKVAKWPGRKETAAVPPVSAAGRTLSDFFVKQTGMEASFTVEAALVMGIVLWTLGFVVKEAYILHDEVTGTMILQEAVEVARTRAEEGAAQDISELAEKRGNPRLWLGTYDAELEIENKSVNGRAAAGEWEKQIEMKQSCPETFLRQVQALLEKRDGKNEDNGGI